MGIDNELINNKFFGASLYTENISDEEYKEINATINTLDALSRTCNLSIYVIDYWNREFIYCSPQHIFLNLVSIDEFKELKYAFFKEFTPIEDYKFLYEINNVGFKFYYDLDKEERLKYTLSYNFNILADKKNKILLNHKITPIRLNSKHEIWLSMCVVTLANKGDNKEIEIRNLDTSQRYLFNTNTRRWSEDTPIIFTEQEISILRLSYQGFSNPEIAKIKYLDVNTIKFHKRKIFSKLGVTNIQEAVVYATSKKLI